MIREKASEAWQDLQPVVQQIGNQAKKTWYNAMDAIENAMDKCSVNDPADSNHDK